jgi:hypothetical protein
MKKDITMIQELEGIGLLTLFKKSAENSYTKFTKICVSYVGLFM